MMVLFSSSLSKSRQAGIPFPPWSTLARTLASVTFCPLTSFARVYKPLSPGPVFFSVLSALWQTAHWEEKTSLPFFGSGRAAQAPVASRRAAIAAEVLNILSSVPAQVSITYRNSQQSWPCISVFVRFSLSFGLYARATVKSGERSEERRVGKECR